MRAPSTSRDLGVLEKLRAHVALLRHSMRGGAKPDLDPIFEEVALYQDLFRQHCGRYFDSAIEIGYGGRPYRLLALHALGYLVAGVDAEAPVLAPTPASLLRVLRRNGFERFAKTLVRTILFDPAEKRAFAEAVEGRGLRHSRPDSGAFAVMDAAEYTPPFQPDLVYSINVFEHVEPRSLERIVERMWAWLPADGLALVRPDIWTGLHGGHSIEWHAHTLSQPRQRRSEPWEHLRRNRFPSNTYMNKFSRRDYRAVFERHFAIVDEIEIPRGREHEYLTDEIRTELSEYTEQDLLDGKPLFVLRPLMR